MEQKVPKHRVGSCRALAERRKVSHTTALRQELCFGALLALAYRVSKDAAQAVQSKRIRIGQRALCQWASITEKEPEYGRHLEELLRHPDLTMKHTNAFVRMAFDQVYPSATEREMDAEFHSDAPDRLSDEELELFQSVVDKELTALEQIRKLLPKLTPEERGIVHELIADSPEQLQSPDQSANLNFR